jgi:tetratricopeptide (TPR) repeat protein
MKKKIILGTILIISVFASLIVAGANSGSAQQLTLTPDQAKVTPINTPIGGNSELEYRVVKLEAEQSQTIEALKETNQRNTSLFTFTSALLGIVVAIQIVVASFQQRRDAKRDGEELVGVRKVNEILTTVRDSFKSRHDAEIQEREGREKAEERLASFDKQIKELIAASARQKANIEKKQQSIEDLALELSKIGRHKFKSKTNQLEKFSNNFDQFDAYFLPIDDIALNFSSYVHFVRGIAAHYGNESDIALAHLKKVISAPNPENVDEVSRKRLIATAYYYLGLIESNFGNLQDSIAYFDQGNKLMSPHVDLFTKIVTAEAYVFNNEFSEAKELIDAVTKELDAEEKVNGDNKSYLVGDRNRATLIKANMLIMLHPSKWQETVQQLLNPLYEKDSSFHFAGVTLAQSYDALGNKELAEKYFRESYKPIRITSGLHTEMRSRILFFMTAGLASKYISEESESKFYLDQASSSCGLLPTLENRACTVFSTLTKRNEPVEKIQEHIDLIREGTVLLVNDK